MLWRSWQPERGVVTFIGLNPSTADADHDDPTIRRCRNFVDDWGYGAMIMVNLFDVRATQPAVMKKRRRPLSLVNDLTLLHSAGRAQLIVAAWGSHGRHHLRSQQMRHLLSENSLKAYCFGLGKTGEPLHPLYQRRDQRPDIRLA